MPSKNVNISKEKNMKNKEIAKKCGDSTILSGHRNIGSSGHRNLNGIYTDVFGGLRERKKSLRKIFGLWPEINYRNLNGNT